MGGYAAGHSPHSIQLPHQRCDGGLQVEQEAANMRDDIPEVASISRSKRAKMNVDGLAKVRAALWHDVHPKVVH